MTENTQILAILAAFAAVALRFFIARDVSILSAISALGAFISGTYATLTPVNIIVGAWAYVNIIGGFLALLGVVLAWPDLSTNWREASDGTRYKIKSRKQPDGLFTEHQEDSRLRHRVWQRKNDVYAGLIAASVAAILPTVILNVTTAPWAGLLTLVAIPVEGYCLLRFSWHQVTRRAYIPSLPKPAMAADDPTEQQPQGPAKRRRDLA